jgi:serine/threonine-protein kinase haspin
LHEGNLCIKQRSPRRDRKRHAGQYFGYSGLDITILDYGLSRAGDLSREDTVPVAYDLEKDLSIFTSTHAPQCQVYRQMRSFMLRADRTCLPPEQHNTPHQAGIDGPLSWDAYEPYTNVLWLAYLYQYLLSNFAGPKGELSSFKKETQELWKYLDPNAAEDVPCFSCAADIVHFAVESGWVREAQLVGASESLLEREDSIIVSRDEFEEGEDGLRRSPRRRRQTQAADA